MNLPVKIIIFILGLSIRSKAQEIPAYDSLYMLQTVSITYRAKEQTPVTFQNIDGKDIKIRSTGQEPSFLLSETPSITVYSDAGNTQGYSYFRIRGIDQTRINMTIDGVPMNEPEDQGAYFSNYPDILNSLSSIQIQRGMGTTKNGTANYAGSIQLNTASRSDTAKTTFGIGYGSFNSMRLFGEYNTGIKRKKSLNIRISEVYSDGYKYHSSNNAQSIFISSSLYNDKSNWKITAIGGRQQNQLAWLGVSDSLINIDRRINANTNENDNFSQGLLYLQNTYHLNSSSAIRSCAYSNFLYGNYDFDANNFIGIPSTNELLNYAFKSNMFGVFSNYTFQKKQLIWTTGIHSNTYNRQHKGSDNIVGDLYRNTGYKNEVSLNSDVSFTTHNVNIFSDIQYRYTSFDYEGSVAFTKMEWRFLNPKVGISYSATNNYTFYYSIGNTGREPTRNALFGGNDNLLADTTGKPLLSIETPEYVTDHELGVRHHSGKLNYSANVYYMDFTNEIVLNGNFGANGLALTNKVDRSFREGIELNIKYRINSFLSVENNSSYNHSRIREQGVVFAPILTPPLIINQDITYQRKRVALTLTGRYQSSSYIDFANSSSLNSYYTINFRLQYNTSHFQFCFFANNVTNSKYANNGYVDYDNTKKYFVQAPANLYASIKYIF